MGKWILSLGGNTGTVRKKTELNKYNFCPTDKKMLDNYRVEL